MTIYLLYQGLLYPGYTVNLNSPGKEPNVNKIHRANKKKEKDRSS